MSEIESLAEAKRRVRRGFLIFSMVACTLGFAQPVVTFWPDGVLKAFAIGAVVAAVGAIAIGGVFLATMPGVDRHLEASWEAKRKKESPNQALHGTADSREDASVNVP